MEIWNERFLQQWSSDALERAEHDVARFSAHTVGLWISTATNICLCYVWLEFAVAVTVRRISLCLDSRDTIACGETQEEDVLAQYQKLYGQSFNDTLWPCTIKQLRLSLGLPGTAKWFRPDQSMPAALPTTISDNCKDILGDPFGYSGIYDISGFKNSLFATCDTCGASRILLSLRVYIDCAATEDRALWACFKVFHGVTSVDWPIVNSHYKIVRYLATSFLTRWIMYCTMPMFPSVDICRTGDVNHTYGVQSQIFIIRAIIAGSSIWDRTV